MKNYFVLVTSTEETSRPSTMWFMDPEHKVLHREDGPAIEYQSGHKEWYQCGVKHRVGGPAIEWDNGHEEWYVVGVRHREDGPAYTNSDGHKEWWLLGKRHREDGPAIEPPKFQGRKEWWYDGVKMTKAQHARRIAPAQYMTMAQIETALGHKVKVVK